MPWYKSGTVSVTLNSSAVIGTSTAFIANARVGDAFRGPDGAWYEVTNIASDTAMSISPTYKGVTTAAGSYALAPMQGYVKDSADALRALVNTYGAKLAALGTTGNYDTLPVSKGGTGGTTQALARSGLGLGTAAVADLQASTVDVTPGVALIPGAFGLGGVTIAIAESQMDSARGTTLMNVSAGGLGKLPTNSNHYVFHFNNPSAGYAFQVARSVVGGQEYTRYQVAGVWDAVWTRNAKSGANSDITSLTGLTTPLSLAQGGTGKASMGAAAVGAVSQSSGVPTGAVIENGGTVAGYYTKYADGTMVCWGYTAPLTIAITNLNGGSAGLYFGNYSKTFPAAFSTLPSVKCSYAVTSKLIWEGPVGDTTKTGFSSYLISDNAVNTAGTFYWIAIGRWF